ncbi:MAG TPA: S8 family serine peptidase [Blastocatellia bacterium]|nr:S8 family serine peptidase [Blastocatellia bacterium]
MKIIHCYTCLRDVAPANLIPGGDVDDSIKALLTVNSNGWEPDKEICIDCLSRYERLHDQLAAAFPHFREQEIKILPTPFRLEAPDELRGRGVTIAFLDSGFYAHPDLTRPNNRILKYINVVGRTREADLYKPDVSSWHGMMTSVVAAGNGHLSGGLYRGIASEASVVLVKVGQASRIRHEDIEKGLRWVIRNRNRYNIRIVNISAGGDHEDSYLFDTLSQAAEEAVRAGIVVVAASGNAGFEPHHPVYPPASVPSVITVGGLDDKNTFDTADDDMYRSSYGPTVDGLQKPEIIAPGIWVAAPILPGTPTAEQAQLLSLLENASDSELRSIIKQHPGVDEDLDHAAELAPYLLRHICWIKIRDNNVISSHYKHVDGTSFAAPIVSSIVAQMLEAVPDLRPHEVKLALIKTASSIPHIEIDRQGWGRVNPRAAIHAAMVLRSERQKSENRAAQEKRPRSPQKASPRREKRGRR